MEKLQEISEVASSEQTTEMIKVSDRSADKMQQQIAESSGTSFGEKKKRRKKLVDAALFNNDQEEHNKGTDIHEAGNNDTEKKDEEDEDYTYEQLAGRVFELLKERNPELAGERRKAVLQAPQVFKDGTKKTVLANFTDICKSMHRQPDHVMSFLLAEAGTTGSLDGQQRLVIKSKFESKNFEGLLRKYMVEYVICQGCKSKNTILTKESRLFFLRCEQCGSSRSVAAVSAGFVARVGRRKHDD